MTTTLHIASLIRILELRQRLVMAVTAVYPISNTQSGWNQRPFNEDNMIGAADSYAQTLRNLSDAGPCMLIDLHKCVFIAELGSDSHFLTRLRQDADASGAGRRNNAGLFTGWEVG